MYMDRLERGKTPYNMTKEENITRKTKPKA
jgi:hypothetical protein